MTWKWWWNNVIVLQFLRDTEACFFYHGSSALLWEMNSFNTYFCMFFCIKEFLHTQLCNKRSDFFFNLIRTAMFCRHPYFDSSKCNLTFGLHSTWDKNLKLCCGKKNIVSRKLFPDSSPLGPSLEEKLFSSCDFTADKTALVSFKSKQSLAEMAPAAKVSTQFQSSTKSRNWAVAPQDLSSVFVTQKPPGAPVVTPAAADSSPQSGSDSGERSVVY